MARKRKPQADFEIYFKDVFPEDVSIRLVAEAVAAIQWIIRADYEEEPSPVHVIDIVRGSAAYRCVAHDPHQALKRLSVIGTLIASNRSNDELAFALPFIRSLSEIAQIATCELILRRVGTDGPSLLATIGPDTYQALKAAHTVSGSTVLFGNLKRVGGATKPRCMIRVPGQRRAVYCSLKRFHAQQLAHRLYESVVLEGVAVWVRGVWNIIEFTVERVVPYRGHSLIDAREQLRRAGADRWDSIPDTDMFFGSNNGAG